MALPQDGPPARCFSRLPMGSCGLAVSREMALPQSCGRWQSWTLDFWWLMFRRGCHRQAHCTTHGRHLPAANKSIKTGRQIWECAHEAAVARGPPLCRHIACGICRCVGFHSYGNARKLVWISIVPTNGGFQPRGRHQGRTTHLLGCGMAANCPPIMYKLNEGRGLGSLMLQMMSAALFINGAASAAIKLGSESHVSGITMGDARLHMSAAVGLRKAFVRKSSTKFSPWNKSGFASNSGVFLKKIWLSRIILSSCPTFSTAAVVLIRKVKRGCSSPSALSGNKRFAFAYFSAPYNSGKR